MKVLRSMSLGVLVAMGIFAGLGLLTPESYYIKESINIKTSPKYAYTFLKDLSKWNQWAFDSLNLEPDLSNDSVYFWNDQSGQGRISISNTIENKEVTAQISMVDGAFQSESKFLIMDNASDSITVVWEETQHLGFNFIARYYAFFADFEAVVSENYQNGLIKLKEAIEENKKLGNSSSDISYLIDDASIESWQNTKKILSLIKISSESTIAEVGAKGGYFSFKLAQSAKNVISLENKKSFYELLKKRKEQEAQKNIEIRFTGVISPAIYEEEVDVVLITHFWEQLQNPEIYLQRIARGLKPSGQLYLLEFFDDIPNDYPAQKVRLPLEKVEDSIKNAGFITIDSVKLDNGQLLISAKKK